MKLKLLILTFAWLDLTKDSRYLPLLDALFTLQEADEDALIIHGATDRFGLFAADSL